MLRYRVAMETEVSDANGFIDIETPMLTKARLKGRVTVGAQPRQ
jgi:aspartyl-tRNA synthetase